MSRITLAPNASGTGTLTVAAPNTNTDRTITLPDATGTLVYADASGNVGIGTTSMDQRLVLSNAGEVFAKFNNSSANYNSYFGSNATGTYIGNDNTLPIVFATSSTERMRIDSSGNLLFNSGYGSVATAYGCRAWVNFNGTGTVAIRASGNVTSITDNGTGVYTVNFTTSMPDANYTILGTVNGNSRIMSINSQSAGSSQVQTRYTPSNLAQDCEYVDVAVFR